MLVALTRSSQHLGVHIDDAYFCRSAIEFMRAPSSLELKVDREASREVKLQAAHATIRRQAPCEVVKGKVELCFPMAALFEESVEPTFEGVSGGGPINGGLKGSEEAAR